MLSVTKTETTDDVLRPGSQPILQKVIACAHRTDRKIGLCVRAKSLGVLLLALALVPAMGCGSIHLNPDAEVAPSEKAENVWTPPPSIEALNRPVTNLEQLRGSQERGALQTSGKQTYDLPSLVDLALRLSPQTRHAWYVALQDEAQLGRSQANNYPTAEAESEGGYFKLPFEFPGQTLSIRNWAAFPQFKVSYDLLDFGRTRANERKAREELIAQNFNFNQAIQDVVFNVERAFYVLAAANANVNAAEANLKLANIALASVEQRHQVGLATKPQVLLAKQVEAQAVYDLENANSQVHNAEASLRQAVGVSADTNLNIEAGQLDRLPKNLSDDVEALIAEAIRRRPDLAAQIAAVRAGDAAIARARAEFYPEISVGGNYGQVIWSYTVNGGHTQNWNQPFYGAAVNMRWDIFTGFDRYYALQQVTAERNAALSDLRSLQLNVIAGTWTAYYDFLSAKKKRDAAEALLTSSEESYQANFESHRYGLATVTDLVTAERDVMAARYTLIQSKADLLISSCNLLHATGAASSGSIP